MNSIFDIFQEYIIQLDANIFAIFTDIFCVALIIYAVYHLLLILKDCFATPKRENYVYGDVAIDTDTSTSTESDLEETFKHVSFMKLFREKQDNASKVSFEDDADDELTDNYNRNIRERLSGSSGNKTLEPSILTDNGNENDEIFNLKSDDNLSVHPHDQNINAIDFSMIGAGETFRSNDFPGDDSLAHAHISVESGDGISPLESLGTTKPKTHSYWLRKRNK